MVRIAPVRLSFNPKTLWFDSNGLELAVGDAVIVSTARGREFGTVSASLFEMDEQQASKLKSPLKPVVRVADEADCKRADELSEMSMLALPVFRQMAAESAPEMNPIAVEYLFDDDKAVFYFDSEERVDFRDLVRKLAAEFHVRVDMKQIGVRDGARMIGGLGHCGQELCCRRLGGEFNPVSIRMAKEQDLSLNPAKISGTCGRLMCCLRYEYDAYRDFHGRAPKKNAKVVTPDGEGKVVDLDVPREVVSVKVGDEKPVRVPLADFEPADEGARPNVIGEEAWAAANEPQTFAIEASYSLFTDTLAGEDVLAEPGRVRHVHPEDEQKGSRSRSRRSRGEKKPASGESQPQARKQRRRRSTTVSVDGESQTRQQGDARKPAQEEAAKRSDGSSRQSSRRRTRNRASKADDKSQAAEQPRSVQVGRKSSALRAQRDGQPTEKARVAAEKRNPDQGQRRRRRSHRTSASDTAGE